MGLADAGQLVEMVHQQNAIEVVVFGGLGLGNNGVKDAFGSHIGVGEVRNLIAESSHGAPVLFIAGECHHTLDPTTP